MAALASVAVPFLPAGLVIGRDHAQKSVVLRVFRNGPSQLALVSGWWAARLLTFRALALGTRVVVHTTAPDQWRGLGEYATGRPDRLIIVPGVTAVPLPTGTPGAPVLNLVDVPGAQARKLPPLGPWQTRVTVLHRLDEHNARALNEADVCLLQRLSPMEARAASGALRLAPRTMELLQQMGDDMLAVIGSGADQYVWATPTPAEQQHLGFAPRPVYT